MLSLPMTSIFAQDKTKQSFCTQAIGYLSMDELKADLLLNAKRMAVNELFGELIVASTAIENFVLTSDQIRTSSQGFIRVDGAVAYSNGDNFAETCVDINAFVTENDKKKFEPVRLEKNSAMPMMI